MRSRRLAGTVAFVTILLSGAAGAVGGELRCVFRVTQQVVRHASPVAGRPAPGEAPGGRTREARRTVLDLACDGFAVTREGETTLSYDFPSRRISVLDLREKTYADLPLYGLVAARVNELVRRRGAGWLPALAARGPEDEPRREPVDEFAVESLFSNRLPDDAARPDAPAAEVLRRGKEWDFEHGDRRFARFIASDRPVPPAYRRSWGRFLVHQCSLHPTVREPILRAGAIPELLEFSAFDAGESSTVTYELESVSEGPGRRPGVPPGFAPKAVPGDRLGPILARLDRREGGQALRTTAAAGRFIDEALARGDALDAYLGWNEFASLVVDDDETRAAKDRWLARILAAKDGRVESLRAPQGEPGGAGAILKTLEAIDRRDLRKGYQIDVWRGFLLAGLGRTPQADDCLLRALEANPVLLNCYRQLGDDHLRAFESVEAWRCYDAIRRIDPDSPMLAEVKQLEARLEKDFPEDF